jgi:hypothetical protein
MIQTKQRIALEQKRIALERAQTTAEGRFDGYASLFGIADLQGDIVMPGAFRESLAKRSANTVKLLWQHDPREPIGLWLSIAEDAKGLRVSGKLNLRVARAREVLSLLKEGSVDGLSIGFRTQRSMRDPSSGLRKLYKLDLWEISLVTFPMLPQARVDQLKSAEPLTTRWRSAAQNFERTLQTRA